MPGQRLVCKQRKAGKLLPKAEGPFEFIAWNDEKHTSALIRNVKTRRELKCHNEHLHPIGGIIPWDNGSEEEEEEEV